MKKTDPHSQSVSNSALHILPSFSQHAPHCQSLAVRHATTIMMQEYTQCNLLGLFRAVRFLSSLETP